MRAFARNAGVTWSQLARLTHVTGCNGFFARLSRGPSGLPIGGLVFAPGLVVPMDERNEVQFREWLALQLRARRMSLRQVALRSGVNVSTVSRIVRGERRPTLRTAVRLARVVRDTADESSATRFFGALTPESLDPVREVERALRADGQLDDDDVRRVMQVYLGARRAEGREMRRRAARATSV